MLQNRLHSYGSLIRWNKPIGTLLLLWPILTALFIANQGYPSANLLVIFVVGAFVMRAAGCIVNDLADIKFDKHVERTKERPLTSGKIKIWEALILLGVLLILAFVLVLQLNLYSLVLAIIGLIITIIYPFMKRWINFPQGVLGIVFNIGILMAFAASNNSISFSGWLLFIIAFIWTISYDTEYAMSDRKDDQKLGLKSSAILFGKKDRLAIACMQIVTIVLLLFLGFINSMNHWFYAGVFLTTLSFAFQHLLIRKREAKQCFQAFINNNWSWLFVFAGVFLNYCK